LPICAAPAATLIRLKKLARLKAIFGGLGWNVVEEMNGRLFIHNGGQLEWREHEASAA
jgi:hypothetical protein